jgi:hypothetical protein
MDHRERDDFYLSKPDDTDDDELEVEPPDADVIASEERRAQEAIEATNATIDIDEIYRDAGRERSGEILENWFRDFKFQYRFQVKHLLIATAVLAIVLTLAKRGMLGTTVVLFVMISVAGLYFYLQWQEKKAQDEATRRRQEMYVRRRAHMMKTTGGGDANVGSTPASTTAPRPTEPLPNATDEAWQEAMSREKFRLRFSMGELMIAMTTAAVIFGLVQILGGASNTATLLGFVALVGLVVHALGFEPPNIVVLGWWFVLVLYVLLSITAAVWTSIA